MFKFTKNDDGIALMMVLVLLILVGGLTASLMAAGVFNIRFGGDEVDRTQAFYAADAGIEHLKANINEIDFTKTYKLAEAEYELEELDIDDGKKDNGDQVFRKFRSTGIYNGVETNIIIDYEFETEVYEFDKPFPIRGDKDIERVTGNPDTEPGWIDEWFDFVPENDWDDMVTVFESLETTIDDIDSAGNSIYNEIIKIEDDFYRINQTRIEDSILIFEGDVDVAGFSGLNLVNSIIIVKGDLLLNGAPKGSLENSAFLVGGDVDIKGERHWEDTMSTSPRIESGVNHIFSDWRTE